MLREMCKSKIHRARVTKTALNYKGSIGIDRKLLEAADIYPGEIVQILNFQNGARFETYAIEEKANSGAIILYGPAARMGKTGDIVIVISKALLESEKAKNLKPKFVYVNEKNRIVKK